MFYELLFAALTDEGKFLLAARRTRCRLHMEYVISIHSDDHSHVNHVGKLKEVLNAKLLIVQ
jgi:tubby and related proteins